MHACIVYIRSWLFFVAVVVVACDENHIIVIIFEPRRFHGPYSFLYNTNMFQLDSILFSTSPVRIEWNPSNIYVLRTILVKT